MLDDAGKLEEMGKYAGWVMSRVIAPGRRNITAFQVAAEGYKRGIPETLIAQMVQGVCIQAGIPDEAESILRSAAVYHGRRTSVA